MCEMKECCNIEMDFLSEPHSLERLSRTSVVESVHFHRCNTQRYARLQSLIKNITLAFCLLTFLNNLLNSELYELKFPATEK